MTTELRSLVATGCRVLGQQDQADLVWGHLSARDPNGRGVWMKRSAIGFDEVGEEDVLLVSSEGEVIGGEGRRHTEYPIHTEIMAARPDVGAVVHTHARSVVAFAALDVPLLPVSHEGTLFTPPDVPRFVETSDLIVTAALGQRVAEVLGDGNAVLLVNHGLVVAATDVPTAVISAILLDRACRMQLTAMAAGPLRRWTDPQEALVKREHCYSPTLLVQGWEYLVRRLNP
jgi:L-ribulose-5-phosphate 4-epimerase